MYNLVKITEWKDLMSHINQSQVKKIISQYLSKAENLITIGILKRIPPTSYLLLTRGMAWIFSKEFYVGVTDQRLIILPESKRMRGEGFEEEPIFADFDEVEFYTDPLNNTILDVQSMYQGVPLKLRFKPGYAFEGTNQFDFIAAVKQGKKPQEESESV